MRLSRISGSSAGSSEFFRPFFWVDSRLRVLAWPEATTRALRRPARTAIGRHCWEVLNDDARTPPPHCRYCPLFPVTEAAAPGAACPGPAAHTGPCAVLPLWGAVREAIVWLPFSRIVAGPATSARLEGLMIRGALAERLDSIAETLDGVRCACAADDCELFLLDPARREVVLVDCKGEDRDAFLERTRMPLGAGYPGSVTLHQRPLFTNRFQSEALFLRSEPKRRGLRSFLGVPLQAGGHALGYLGLGWRDDAVPPQWGIPVLEQIKPLVIRALQSDRATIRSLERLREPRLVVRCFGPLEIVCGGRTILPEAFPRRKAIALLRILLLAKGSPIHRDRLIEQLWPDAPPGRGANRLHSTLNALRSTLEAGRRQRVSDYIVCRNNRYHFNTEAPHAVDLFDFLDRLSGARAAQRAGAEERALVLYREAMALYRGDLFADDAEDSSIEAHRVSLRHSCAEAARELAGILTRRGEAGEAIRLLRAMLDLEPAAYDLHESLIVELARDGQIVEARQQYECCRAALRCHLDMELPARARALEKLLSSASVPASGNASPDAAEHA